MDMIPWHRVKAHKLGCFGSRRFAAWLLLESSAVKAGCMGVSAALHRQQSGHGCRIAC